VETHIRLDASVSSSDATVWIMPAQLWRSPREPQPRPSGRGARLWRRFHTGGPGDTETGSHVGPGRGRLVRVTRDAGVWPPTHGGPAPWSSGPPPSRTPRFLRHHPMVGVPPRSRMAASSPAARFGSTNTLTRPLRCSSSQASSLRTAGSMWQKNRGRRMLPSPGRGPGAPGPLFCPGDADRKGCPGAHARTGQHLPRPKGVWPGSPLPWDRSVCRPECS